MFGFVDLAAGPVRAASESTVVFRNSGLQLGMFWISGVLHLASRPGVYGVRRTCVGVQCGKLPPSSPDLNPIENVWAMLNLRLARTKPTRWESEKAFRVRVRNAVLWLNSSRGAVLKRLISSMPRRVQACVEVNGGDDSVLSRRLRWRSGAPSRKRAPTWRRRR